jgi:hypothetical protein
MSTTTPTAEESIGAEPTVEPRTRRAAEGCMAVVPEGDASGRFDVFGEIVTCSADSVRRALETEASR